MLWHRLRGIVGLPREDQEFDTELRDHLDLLIEDYLRNGMSPAEARRAAHIRLGGVGPLKESQRDLSRVAWLDALVQDVRFAARILRKTPGFTAVAVLTLAVGIGVNTTVFTAYNTVALKPLAVRDPDSVVRLQREFARRVVGNVQYGFSYPEYAFIRDHDSQFASLTANAWPAAYTARLGGAAPERWSVEFVSGNYFSSLGVGAALGRTILPDDDRVGAGRPVALLSHAFWQQRFGSSPHALGESIDVNGVTVIIAGVVSTDFSGSNVPPQAPDIWMPLQLLPALNLGADLLRDPARMFVQVLGRLKPGVSRAGAAEAALVELRQFEDHFAPVAVRPSDQTVAITLPAATLFGNTDDPRVRITFFAVLALVSTVLLIACANLANMLMARAASRQRELALRLALGAGRFRLLRQLMTESLLLGIAGGAGGLVLSIWSCRLLIALIQRLAGDFSATEWVTMDVRPDVRVLLYALGVSLVAGAVFGVLPALRFSKPDVNAALKNESATSAGGREGARMRSMLLASQAAASLLLLIMAGLLLRGLLRSRAAQPGFETRNAYAIALDYGADHAKALALQRLLVQNLASLPDLKGVVSSDRVPMMGTWTPPVEVPPSGTFDQLIRARTGASRVGPGYFETMGVALVDGRTFTSEECQRSAPVVIVSQAAAQRFWPGRRAVGRRVRLDLHFSADWKEFEVVGVARDVRNANLSRIDPAFVYLPVSASEINTILFTTRDGIDASGDIRQIVARIAPEALPSLHLISIERVPLRVQRLISQLSAAVAIALAAIALLLASSGIYAVMHYLVSQRVKEIGIRMALGADAGGVSWFVIRQGLRPVLIGSVIGTLAAAAVSTALRAQLQFPGAPDMLYGVNAFDPLTYGGLIVFLALAALCAAWLPARRAARVDPMIAVRCD